MRTRKEIENETNMSREKLFLEVLLDVRDLLQEISIKLSRLDRGQFVVTE